MMSDNVILAAWLGARVLGFLDHGQEETIKAKEKDIKRLYDGKANITSKCDLSGGSSARSDQATCT